MELTKEIVKEGIKKKGLTELEFCKSVDYSQPSLHRFYNSGQIRVKNARKIIEFLELEEKKTEQKVIKTQFEEKVNISETSMFERLLKRLEELTIENFTLKRELGKFRPVSFNPAFAS